MALYDDKRFILSHIRHSFITSDDSTMCENVMLYEPLERYNLDAIYQAPIQWASQDELDDDQEGKDDRKQCNDHALNKVFTTKELQFLKETEVDLKSELIEDSSLPNTGQLSDQSYDISIRRRSNTAQRLEKLKQEKKVQAKTKSAVWKSFARITALVEDGKTTKLKRAVVDPIELTPEEIAMLDFNSIENIYYETEAYRHHLFPSTNSPQHDSSGNRTPDKKKKKSALTYLIEKSPSVPVNPFNQFTQFDARVTEDNFQSKQIQIFIRVHESNPEFQNVDFTKKISSTHGIACGPKWIEVNCLATTRICDLVGLVCWHYTQLQLGPPLEPDASKYALKICEENGDIDSDFPSLTPLDEIKRYGFPYLAMVEAETLIEVTVFIESEQVFSQISASSSTPLKDVVEQIVKKRAHLFKNKNYLFSAKDYYSNIVLEHSAKPNVALDLDSCISEYLDDSAKAVSFKMKLVSPNQRKESNHNPNENIEETSSLSSHSRVKAESSTSGTMRQNYSFAVLPSLVNEPVGMTATTPSLNKKSLDLKDWSSNVFNQMEAPIYKTFSLVLLNKFHSSLVELGICGAYIEMTPKQHNSRSPSTHFTDRLFSKFQHVRAQTIQMESVVDVYSIIKHSSQHKVFKLVYHNGHSYKKFKFEGDASLVNEILLKLKHCMQMANGVRRLEYEVTRARKKSFTTKSAFKSRLSLSSSSSSNGHETDSIVSSQSEHGDSIEHTQDNDEAIKKPNHRSAKFK